MATKMIKRKNTGVSWSDESRRSPIQGEATKRQAFANPKAKIQDKASDYPWRQAYSEAVNTSKASARKSAVEIRKANAARANKTSKRK